MKLRFFTYSLYLLVRKQKCHIVPQESTRHRGKDYCKDGLQFNWVEFDKT